MAEKGKSSQSPVRRAKAADRMRALHADPEFKAKMRALHADPKFKAKAAERMRALNADPVRRAKSAERMRALHADPEFKAKMRALHADPEFKAKMRAGRRGVDVPAWAESAGLADDYISVALDFDEITAARHCRCLLAEMRKGAA